MVWPISLCAEVSYVTFGNMRAFKILFAMSLGNTLYSSCLTNLSPGIEPMVIPGGQWGMSNCILFYATRI